MEKRMKHERIGAPTPEREKLPMTRAATTRNAGMGYTGGARGGFSFATLREAKRFSRSAASAETGTSSIAPIAAVGGAMAKWQSVQLAAEHWSWWWHTIPIVIANTSTINTTETVACQLHFESGIAAGPVKGVYLIPMLSTVPAAYRNFNPAPGDGPSLKSGPAKPKPQEWERLHYKPRNGNETPQCRRIRSVEPCSPSLPSR
jgi:hypothetical protein